MSTRQNALTNSLGSECYGGFEDGGRWWYSDIGLKQEVFAGVICRCGAGVFDQSS